MAWYKTGTVSVTNGSTTVTGSGTNFVSGAQVGEAFYGPDDDLYEITAINSATSLTIGSAYGGATASGQSYAIVPTQSLVADLASDVADLISDYQTIADEAGAGKFGDGSAASPSIKFTQDQDTGFFRDTANEIAISAGGSKIGSFTANGLEFLDNEKFTVGTGSDFSIYHNGNNTFLEESGTGALVIRSNALNIQNAAGTETLAQFIEDGAVTLRYDNEIKLQTTANGVNFTAETVGITGTTGSTKLQITSTDDGAGDGPLLQLYRDSSTPEASDNIARIDFLGENSTGGQIAYARIDTFIQDPTAGSEQGRMRFLIESESTQRSFIEMDASAGGAGGRTWVNSGQADIDFRVSGDTDANLLYVDASTDRVGVGTGAPTSELDVNGTITSDGLTVAKGEATAYNGSATDGQLTAGATAFLQQTAGSNIAVSQIVFQPRTGYGYNRIVNSGGSAPYMTFVTNDEEAMRITSDKSLLVGTTSTAISNEGAVIYPSGVMTITNDDGRPLRLNRKTSDGDILQFDKDGSTVGSIGISGTRFYFAQPSFNGIGVATNFFPTTSAGVLLDNVMDCGIANARWDDIYATNATIQTSDQNEKQQIASLTDAEMTAAKAISKLFKTFKWNDSVTEKGDAARTHAGVIAQDVEQAMTDAGLNAGDYAFFISTTWWETQTDVPAVEAVEAVDATYDEDGNMLTEAVEAVEAQEAYTRTDTYETLEEAPEGATECNRKGIRYPELLSFIGAATEQRLASIETRLDALESA